jgi:hypothetical protein
MQTANIPNQTVPLHAAQTLQTFQTLHILHTFHTLQTLHTLHAYHAVHALHAVHLSYSLHANIPSQTIPCKTLHALRTPDTLHNTLNYITFQYITLR